MDFKIFRNKTLSTSKDKMLLAQPTMLFRTLDPNEYAMVAKHIVTEDDIVRPDLISVKHYGGTDGLDIILKFNGISDPFSIMPGETIYVPVDTIPYYRLETPDMYEDNPIKNQFLKTKRLSKTDQRRIEALKKKYNKESLLPPNVIPVGRKNYEFDGTDVRLGMGPQTDPVVNSILSEMKKAATSDNDNLTDIHNTPDIISQNENNISDDNSYEDDLINNANGNGGDRDNNGIETIEIENNDIADELGGEIPDGDAPASTDDPSIDEADSPCAK